MPPGATALGEAPIRDDYGYNQGISRDLNAVHDVMLTCWMNLFGPGRFTLVVQDGTDSIQATFTPAKSVVTVHEATHGRTFRSRYPARVDKLRRLEISLFDRRFILALDGATLVQFDLPAVAAGSPSSQPFRLGAKDLVVQLKELKVWRDIYYLNDRGLSLPWQAASPLGRREIFVLGDNPPISSDSRNWESAGLPHNLLIGRVFRQR